MLIQLFIIAVVGAVGESALALGPGNPVPQVSIAYLYSDTNQKGTVHVVRSSGRCVNLPASINDDASSINTKNTCMELFAHQDCEGPSYKYFPGKNGGSHWDLHEDGFGDKATSAKKCTEFGRKLE